MAHPTRLDTPGLLAAVVLGTLGGLTIMIVPGFVGLVGSLTGLDDQSLGYVASWDINAMAVAIGAGTFLISRFNWRHLALLALAIIGIGNLWTATCVTYPAVVAARVLAGCGEGLAIAVSFAALGSASNPDRAFGIYLVVGLTVSAGILVVLPALQVLIGPSAMFIGLALIAVSAAAIVKWLPTHSSMSAVNALDGVSIQKVMTVAGLTGVFLYFIAQGAMWSYFERIGASNGIDPDVIGQAMGVSSFSGTGGALVAVLLTSRVSRAWLLAGSGAISLLSFWLLMGTVSAAQLFVAGILFNFGWNLAQPLLSGVCAEADARGRVVVAMGCIQTVGFGVGPALAAALLTGHNFVPAAWMSTAVLICSLAIVLGGLRARGLQSMPRNSAVP
ncbi:MFS transporter [Azospirillum sp. B4]|uniref:MFS transporter n=1 Tax=Azospirillum sp. B4 TaxID=95605 RepID=UPI0011DD0478|nr:MFS transporter [Azospirillum sp. B4]